MQIETLLSFLLQTQEKMANVMFTKHHSWISSTERRPLTRKHANEGFSWERIEKLRKNRRNDLLVSIFSTEEVRHFQFEWTSIKLNYAKLDVYLVNLGKTTFRLSFEVHSWHSDRKLFNYMQNYFAYGKLRSEEKIEAHFSARINTILFNFMQVFTAQFWRK